MSETSPTTRLALVCRSIGEANRGGTLEEVDARALADSFARLRLLEPQGAAKVENAERPAEPTCPTVMPKSFRLLQVPHRGQMVGVVVPTFKGGAQAQQDGVISEASGNAVDRSNLASFFRGGTSAWN